jgi:DNA mismatch endonuclease (patch repair protein)
LVELFRKNHISGWRRHPKDLFGKPDFIFRKKKVALFVDGCFWHGCRQIKKAPKANRKFWVTKVGQNIVRDKTVNRTLRKGGWKVVRIWEHELKKSPVRLIVKVTKIISD